MISEDGAIGVSKAALEALTRYLGVESPGAAFMSMPWRAACSICRRCGSTRALSNSRPTRFAGQTAQRRTAEDIARIVLFLCSPLADWMAGQTLVADGGMSLTV